MGGKARRNRKKVRAIEAKLEMAKHIGMLKDICDDLTNDLMEDKLCHDDVMLIGEQIQRLGMSITNKRSHFPYLKRGKKNV